MKTIEKLQGDCNQIRIKYEDLKKSKQDTLKEVLFLLLLLLYEAASASLLFIR